MRIIRPFVFVCFTFIIMGCIHAHASHLMSPQRDSLHTEYMSTPVPTIQKMIVISISASTNACASILVVSSTGDIVLFNCHYFGQRHILSGLSKIFFHDVYTLQPLDNLPVNNDCLKSASFGTTTIISFELQTSPDISCSLDGRGEKLFHDVFAIQIVVGKQSMSPGSATLTKKYDVSFR